MTSIITSLSLRSVLDLANCLPSPDKGHSLLEKTNRPFSPFARLPTRPLLTLPAQESQFLLHYKTGVRSIGKLVTFGTSSTQDRSPDCALNSQRLFLLVPRTMNHEGMQGFHVLFILFAHEKLGHMGIAMGTLQSAPSSTHNQDQSNGIQKKKEICQRLNL